jgi:hypothetical protein
MSNKHPPLTSEIRSKVNNRVEKQRFLASLKEIR